MPESDTPSSPPPQAGSTAAGGNPIVLVAEDNPLNQKIVVRMVRGLGCTVDAVGTGLEVVAAVRGRRYDFVLMDIRMPDMNGIEAAEAIRRELPPEQRPRIFALTAGVSPDERQACYDAGMEGFVSKPVVVEQLALLFGPAAAKPAAKP
jgi:CheY-like chemotaxis protein